MRVRLAAVGALVCALVFMVGGAGAVPSTSLVVSQVYGGGGNSGAPLTHDYIEIFNRGSSPVSLGAYSLQYASATGSGNFGGTATQLTELPNVTLQPGQYFLVQQAAGAGSGVPLPAPDHADPTPIAMAAGSGKVAVVTGTDSLGCNGGSTPCSPAQLSRIVDLVGYGSANFFEGSAAAPTLSNQTAAFRADNGCTDTDQNGADFTAGAPGPRNTASPLNACDAENAPFVSSTTPTGGASGVARDASITIEFSEPVGVSGAWYEISCDTSGSHTAAQSGGPQTYALDPDADFAFSETCTVTVFASQVSDQDADDPPDNMDADHTFSFTTETPPVRIREIQGAGHLSPYDGMFVSGVEGVVTGRRGGGGGGFWIQDPEPDADDATSEGIFVFTAGFPGFVSVGQHVSVAGHVAEFRPGCSDPCTPDKGGYENLTVTQITSPSTAILSSGNPIPAPVTIGPGGRTPPTENIDDDGAGNVETGGSFEPAQDAIDFYESLEGMLARLAPGAAVVGPTKSFGEVVVLPDGGLWATGLRTPRGGILYSHADPNPERVIVDDEIIFRQMPSLDVGDVLTSEVVGPVDYSFANYKIQATFRPSFASGGLARESSTAPRDQELTVATFNVENLSPNNPQSKFDELAGMIVGNLKSPDLLGIEEVQDNSGFTNDGTTDASETWARLIEAIQVAGGPLYEYRQIDPLDNVDGGAPGGNIRVGFLFRTDRGLSFTDRPGGDATTATQVVAHPSGPRLTLSPGRIAPNDPSYFETRKSLAGEFRFRGKKLFAVVVHFSSKGDDDALFGRFQPPVRHSETARHGQAQAVADFVADIQAVDPNAYVVVLGDINDFQFSETIDILEGAGLTTFVDTLAPNEQYSYVFEGNSQILDQILGSDPLLDRLVEYDVVHVNSEFAVQASDHEPSVARINMIGRP